MTQRDFMRIGVQMAALVLCFRLLPNLTLDLFGLAWYEGTESIPSLLVTTAFIIFSLSLWMNPDPLMRGAQEEESTKIMRADKSRFLIAAGLVVLGLYFAATSLVGMVDNITQGLQNAYDGDSSQAWLYLMNASAAALRLMFAIVLVLKAPALALWLSRHMPGETADL